MIKPSIKYALLAELLRTLEAEGFAFGVDKHLQLQQLLEQLPDDISAKQLKQSLAPAIATNEQEQQFFYLLFDKSLKRVEAVQAETFASPPTPPTKSDNWLLPAISFLTLLLIPLIWMLIFPPPPISRSMEKEFTADLDSTYVLCFEEIGLQEFKLPIQNAFFCSNNAHSDSSLLGTYRFNTDFCLNYTAGDSLLEDASICTHFIDSREDTFTVYFEPQLQKPPSVGKDTLSEEDKTAQATVFDYKDYPIHSDVLSLKTPELDEWQQFYADHYKWLKLLFALIATLLTLLLLLWRERKRRKLVAEVDRQNNPPFIWNIETEEQPLIQVSNDFDNLLNGLRKRAESDHQVFSAKKTINATIAQGGMIDFQYSAQTRPPEYLLLLDRESGDSHRARFFNYLQERFLENEVFIHRYFYSNDLRRAWNEQNASGLSLKELGRLHPDARLIVIGNAYQLLSPLSGKLAKWAKIVEQWKERAILSYVPSAKWGRREQQLGKEFIVLPASPDSLHFLVDQWDQGEEAEFEKWRDVVKDAPAEPITWQGDLITTLEQQYSPAMLRWIAACAVYPSLHWDATLFLGEQLSTPDAPLLQLDNLHKLNRLDWFTQGEIPQEARAGLLNWLEANHPETLQKTRENLFELLQENPPPKDSAAFEDYQLNRDLNEWLITTDRGRKRELQEDIATQIDNGTEPDFTVIKYLDRARNPLDFIIPNTFKKYVYNSGFKGLGLQRIQRDLMWASPILLTILGIAFLWSPNLLQCGGEEVSFLEITIQQLEEEQALMLEKIENTVLNSNLQKVGEAIDTNRYEAIRQFFLRKEEQYPEALSLCIIQPEDVILEAEYTSRLLVEAGLYPETTRQTRVVNALYQRTENTPLLDSAFVAYHRNTAVAFYNKGVELQFRDNQSEDSTLLVQKRADIATELAEIKRNLNAELKTGRGPKSRELEQKREELEAEISQMETQLGQLQNNALIEEVKDSMCFYFDAAYGLDSVDVDIRYANNWCGKESLFAFFKASPESCCAPCQVEFTNLSTGANRYIWYFGDGQRSETSNPRHRYNKPGKYTVVLDAYDANDEIWSHEYVLDICEKEVVVMPPKTANPPNETVPDSPIEPITTEKEISIEWIKQPDNTKAKGHLALNIKNASPYLLGINNLRVLHNGEEKAANGNFNRQLTYREDIDLYVGDNTFSLRVIDDRGNILAESEERTINYQNSDNTIGSWIFLRPAYFTMPYFENYVKYSPKKNNYYELIELLYSKEDYEKLIIESVKKGGDYQLREASNYSSNKMKYDFGLMIESVGQQLESGHKVICTIEANRLSERYGKSKPIVAELYSEIFRNSMIEALASQSKNFDENQITFILKQDLSSPERFSADYKFGGEITVTFEDEKDDPKQSKKRN